MLEGLLGFLCFWISSTLSLILSYILMTQMWLTHQGHLALICIAQHQSTQTCEQQVRQSSEPLIRFGHIERVQFLKRATSHDIKIHWRLLSFHFLVQQNVDWNRVIRKRVL